MSHDADKAIASESPDEFRARTENWKTHEPSDGFAISVLDRIREGEPGAADANGVSGAVGSRGGVQKGDRKWMRRLWLVAALLPLAGGLFWVTGQRSVGETVASERIPVNLGRRAVAVLESGAHVKWNVGLLGGAHVQQPAGNVFYRVTSGGEFSVETPAGNISVHGTCFRVEVTDMKTKTDNLKKLGAAAAGGALVAASVVVTVYEGRVALANEHGEVALTAGETSTASTEVAPSAPGPFAELAGATIALDGKLSGGTGNETSPGEGGGQLLSYAQLRAAYHQQRQELADLKKKVAAGGGRDSKNPLGHNERMYPPDADTLLVLADKCAVQTDSGPILADEFDGISDGNAEQMGMLPAERKAYDRLAHELVADTRALLEKSYLDLGGSEAVVGELGAWALASQISQMQRDEHVHEQISKERAGLVPARDPSKAMTPKEEAIRWITGLGDEMQVRLGKEIGADRAHELRARKGGWMGGRSTWSGCQKKRN